MKATITLLTSQRETKKGFPICVELFISSKNRPRKNIGASKIEYWDSQNNIPTKDHPEYYVLYPKVLEYVSKITKINHNDYTPEEAANFLFSDNKKVSTKKGIGYIDFFNVRINEKAARKEATKNYKEIRDLIKNYLDNTDVLMHDLDYEWVNEFINFKYQTGCNEGGVMSYLRTMSAVYNEASKRSSLNITNQNPFKAHLKKPKKKDVIVIPEQELLKLTNFSPHKFATEKSKFNMQRALAVWRFQLFVGGHDYIDMSQLRWEQIKNNRIKFKRYKNREEENGGPEIDNYLFDELLSIIKAYGTPNSSRIFSFIPDPVKDNQRYIIYRQNVSRTLAKIAKQSGMKHKMKTKSVRYIFKTYAEEIMTHDTIIKKLMGHSLRGVSFNYLGKLSYSVVDDAHRRIIDYILNPPQH